MEGESETTNNYMDMFDNTVDRVMNLLNFEVVPRNRKPADENNEELKKNLSSERERRIAAEEKLLEAENKLNIMSGEFGSFINKLFDSLTIDTLSKSLNFLQIGPFQSKSERDDWTVKLRNLGVTLQDNCGDTDNLQNKLNLLKSFNENSMKISDGNHDQFQPPAENGSEINVTPNSSSSSASPSKYKKYTRISYKKRHALKHGVNRTESSPTKHVCICGKEFGKLKNLCMHIRRAKFSEWRYKCDACGKRFFLPSELKKHMKKVDHVNTHFFHCSYCNKRFEREDILFRHIAFNHKIKSSLGKNQQLLKNRIDDQPPSPRKHEEVENPNNQDEHLCRCGFTSVSRTTLKYHMRLMRGDNKNSNHHSCISCTLVEKETPNGDDNAFVP